MSSLQIISHTPTINQSGVLRNSSILVNFDRPIKPQSITWGTFSVHDKQTYSTVVGDLGAVWTSSGTVVQASFTPTMYLAPNTEYTVYVFGTPNSVIGIDGSQLSSAYQFDFITGIEYSDVSGNIGIPSGYTSGLMSGTIAGFNIRDTDPKNQEPDVLDSGVIVYFNIPIATSLSDISGYIFIRKEDVLD